jgi:hypothetical protein
VKSISTLVEDINKGVGSMEREGLVLSRFSDNITSAYKKQMSVREEKVRTPNTLYFSEIGEKCQRKMWYKYNSAVGEDIPPATRVKFLYGDMLEELVLQLARDTGHTVTDEQLSVEYDVPGGPWKVRGRIDAIVDGCVVDVKSVTKMSEQKFHNHLEDDPFGYYGQLNGYATVLKNSEMGFLTIQKELGHINYFPFTQDSEVFAYGVARAVATVSAAENGFDTLPDVPASATSKNMKLCTSCSYCPYKKQCFPDVRGFAYSNKVEWLTKVVDTPRVPEIVSE